MKGITLKVNSLNEEYKDSSSSEEDVENFNLMVRKFEKFLRKTKDRKFSKCFRKIEKITTTTSHASNVVSKVISNLCVLSTLESMLVKRNERMIENKRKAT